MQQVISRKIPYRALAWSCWSFFLVPSMLYFCIFAVATLPMMQYFSTHLFGDNGDGLQNVWNIWQVRQSFLHAEPLTSLWYTKLLHFPYGTTLLLHTLALTTTVPAQIFLPFFSPVQTYNAMVIFSFVLSGTAMFWLAYDQLRAYWPSLAAGYFFTFSSYHWAHGLGHLNLIAIGWFPLLVLCLLRFFSSHRIRYMFAAGVILAALFYTDYAYFFYGGILSAMICLWHLFRRNKKRVQLRIFFRGIAAAAGTALMLTGNVLLSIFATTAYDPVPPTHNAYFFAADLLSFSIPGKLWVFSDMTRTFWSHLPAPAATEETIGVTATILLIIGWAMRKRLAVSNVTLWYSILAISALLSLGHTLRIWGIAIATPMLPYSWLETLIPPVRLSGVAIRYVVLLTLAAALLLGAILRFFAQRPHRRLLAIVFFLLLALEIFPKQPFPHAAVPIPLYVQTLAQLPRAGVLDAVSGSEQMLYYQTFHQQPLALGSLARIPESVRAQSRQVLRSLNQRRYRLLWRHFHIRYLVLNPAAETTELIPVRIMASEEANVYDLAMLK